MRNKILSLLLITSIILLKSQTTVGETHVPASISSYASYINSPVSITTGIPNISFPLMSLPTHKKDYSVNIGISYHPSNIKGEEPASDVGSGWSLMYGGIISRKAVNGVDGREEYLGGTNINPNNVSNDIYYYSLPTASGKFKIEKKSDYNFEVQNLSPSNVKIELIGTAKKNFYQCDSFKITDEKGYQYIFNDYAISQAPAYLYVNMKYWSAFYLNKILSPSNQELVNYQNKDYSTIVDGELQYRFYKPEIITSRDFGSITLSYDYNANGNVYDDPCKLLSIDLKDKNGSIVEQRTFDYNSIGHSYTDYDFSYSIYKRVLSKITKRDKSSNIIDATQFSYEEYGYGDYGPIPDRYGTNFLYDGIDNNNFGFNPKFMTKGLLKKVRLPAGGQIEYVFGANRTKYQYIQDVNSQEFQNEVENAVSLSFPQIQYLQKVDSLRMDTKDATSSFNVNLQKSAYIRLILNELYPTGNPDFPSPFPDPSPWIKIRIKNNGSNAYLPSTTIVDAGDISVLYFKIEQSGSYKVELYGTGGNADVELYQLAHIPPPYKNDQILNDAGIRIETIKYYPVRDQGSGDILPTRIDNYDYQLASDVNTSAGTLLYAVDDTPLPYINYKNVKISSQDGKGFSRYYFKTLKDFPDIEIENTSTSLKLFKPYFNLVDNGFLEKKETYNSNNQLVSDDLIQNVYENIEPQFEFYNDTHNHYYTKAAFVKSQKITSHIYDESGNSMENITETTNSSLHYNLSYKKQSAADGNVTESNYLYAKDRGDQNLIQANVLGVPVETSSKLNGQIVGRTETLFENPGHSFPTSSLSYSGNNNLADKVTFDLYDGEDNLLQYTDQSGLSTAIIWGYNNTQPIAKIEGAKYSDVLSVMGVASNADLDIVKKSDLDVSNTDNTNEQLLRDALEVFRKKPGFKNYLITTYTYDSLIGIKSITSRNGMTEYRYYDHANRLQRTENAEHKVLQEYKYNSDYYPY